MWNALKQLRSRSGLFGPGKTAVYNFCSGNTHQRGVAEACGRKSKVPSRIVSAAATQRRKLTKAAGNEYIVTWEDVRKATKKMLKEYGCLNGVNMPSVDWFSRTVRSNTEIRARAPKKRIGRTLEHENIDRRGGFQGY